MNVTTTIVCQCDTREEFDMYLAHLQTVESSQVASYEADDILFKITINLANQTFRLNGI